MWRPLQRIKTKLTPNQNKLMSKMNKTHPSIIPQTIKQHKNTLKLIHQNRATATTKWISHSIQFKRKKKKKISIFYVQKQYNL